MQKKNTRIIKKWLKRPEQLIIFNNYKKSFTNTVRQIYKTKKEYQIKNLVFFFITYIKKIYISVLPERALPIVT
jgi:hypothetical protein